MIAGWRYRWIAVTGVGVISLVTLLIANHTIPQQFVTTYVPLFWQLNPTVLSGPDLRLTAVVSVTAVSLLSIPLYKPRPRRILDTAVLAQKQILIAGLALATLGYFNWTYRVPRGTLLLFIGLLSLVIPVWFVLIRQRDHDTHKRTILIGDDTAQMDQITADLDDPVLGYLCPATTYRSLRQTPQLIRDTDKNAAAVVDGGHPLSQLDRLGGLSQFETVLTNYGINNVVLGFQTADRGEFFGTLDICHKHGISAQVHREYADDVLTSTSQAGTLVDVDVEPLDPQEYAFKRVFDVLFSYAGLILLAPLMFIIGVAIKLDSSGPVLYDQDRTASFGETFTVYKFRTMVTDAEAETGAKISDEEAGDVDPRVTRVGRILRKTHMDEIPQLWAILTGQMSVVGPRPERPEIDSKIQIDNVSWSKRWLIKPGLTGLAQINGVTGREPAAKLRYDIQYIRDQSLTYDMLIVIRQIWMVLVDGINLFLGCETEATAPDESTPESDRVDD